MKWLSLAVHARAPLRRFDTLTHEGMVNEFRELDERGARGRTGRGLVGAASRPGAAQTSPARRRPLRFRCCGGRWRSSGSSARFAGHCATANRAIRAIKPCFMMSPLTVAQFLDGSEPTFDLVIFDEASQLPTEDAVGAIVRGSQLVVVGDPKQLPPTNFFSVSSGTVDAPVGEDGTPLYEDSESILEEFMGAAVPMSRLKWHYRSAHESLISFSNVNFYDADLYTFPSVETDSSPPACSSSTWRTASTKAKA